MFYDEDTQKRFVSLLAAYGAHSLLLTTEGEELAVYAIAAGAQPLRLTADCPVVGLAPSANEAAAEAIANARTPEGSDAG